MFIFFKTALFLFFKSLWLWQFGLNEINGTGYFILIISTFSFHIYYFSLFLVSISFWLMH